MFAINGGEDRLMGMGRHQMMMKNNNSQIINDNKSATADLFGINTDEEAIHVSIVRGATSRTNDAYQPNPVSVEAGHNVIWIDNDFNIHTVTEGSPFSGRDSINTESEFDSDLFGPGNSFTHLFNKIGTYDYYCTLHPWMVDRVIVVTND